MFHLISLTFSKEGEAIVATLNVVSVVKTYSDSEIPKVLKSWEHYSRESRILPKLLVFL